MTQDSIEVKSGMYNFVYFNPNDTNDVIVYKAKIDSLKSSQLGRLGLKLYSDSLKSQYTNLCILDGMIIHFHFEWADKIMGTTLSNYYLNKMTPFVELMNSVIPNNYEIWYDKKWLDEVRKDCPDDQILE